MTQTWTVTAPVVDLYNLRWESKIADLRSLFEGGAYHVQPAAVATAIVDEHLTGTRAENAYAKGLSRLH